MAIDLHKSAEKVGINLKKRGIENPPLVRVGAAWDISGSAQQMYYDGEMQSALNMVLGLAMAFDPSHKLDNWVFDDKHAQLPIPATPENYLHYIHDQVLQESAIRKWGGTQYAGVTHEMQDHYFGERHNLRDFFRKHTKVVPLPALCFIFTDGDNQDITEARQAFERAAAIPIFFGLVGIGHHSFSFLKELDSSESDCEFINLSDLRISDDELYAKIVSPKLANWLRTHPQGNRT